ncbi:MAG: hypothetical protein GY849_02555 [Deltaproteobacteria bacterium]|nr:hypothetical protein [Deltaproteobacteria bacterium]
MKFLELDLENIIFENLQTKEGRELLNERGLDVFNEIKYSKRQLRIGSYGITDIVTYTPQLVNEKIYEILQMKQIQIVELKKNEINIDTLLQSVRYLKGIKRYLRGRGYDPDEYRFEIILIGKSVNKGDWIYLNEIIQDYTFFSLYIYTYNYKINGILFDNITLNYHLSEEGFENLWEKENLKSWK